MSEPEKTGDARAEKSHIFPERKKGRIPTLPRGSARASTIALQPVSGLLVGAACGYFLGKYCEGDWVFPLFLMLGLAVGCMNAYRDIKAMTREHEAEDAAKKPPYR